VSLVSPEQQEMAAQRNLSYKGAQEVEQFKAMKNEERIKNKEESEVKKMPIINTNKVGRNDPCPCGAKHADGRPIKFKHCHGK
jgi:uncharacterized protein YecA (UPF0149 family)